MDTAILVVHPPRWQGMKLLPSLETVDDCRNTYYILPRKGPLQLQKLDQSLAGDVVFAAEA